MTALGDPQNGAPTPRDDGADDGAQDVEEAAKSPPTAKRGGDDRRLARSAARLAAVQALYQMEITGGSATEVAREFENHRIGAEIEGAQYREADIEHFRALLDGVVAHQREIDRLTDAALVARWPLGKIDPTLRAIFRCGGAELVSLAHVPPRVAITEYVDVAKAFFTEGQEARFVNAVLDHMARRARPDSFEAPPPPGDARSDGGGETEIA